MAAILLAVEISAAAVSAGPPVAAPSGLTYSANPAAYLAGAGITANTPQSTGGPVASYSVSPALPVGLGLDSGTGIVTGTPTALSGAADYIVTATNPAGSTTADLNIAVFGAPSPTTGASTNVTTIGATLSGTAAGNFALTSVVYQYGTTTGYGTTAAAVPAQAFGSTPTASTATLTGLMPNTPYHYRIAATNAGGTSFGADNTFTTLPLIPPSAPNGTASAFTGTKATITLPFPAVDSSSYNVSLTGVAPDSHLTVNSTGVNTVTFTPSVTYAGSATLTYSVTDTAGSMASGTITVTVVDNIPPVLTKVANVVAEATSLNNTVATFPPATATDNVTANPTIAYSANSGSTFPLGVTTVTVTATDAANNSSTETFTVTVRDTTPPTPTIFGSNPVTIALGSTYVDAGASAYDAVSGTLYARFPMSTVNTAAAGHYTVTYRFVDSSNNVATAVRTVIVVASPVTGSFTTGRQSHTSTLLQNGKVLAVGGVNGSSATVGSGELYDPGTGAWSATGSLIAARTAHTATMLPTGKVLVVGGSGAAGFVLASAELYDPATGVWTSTGSLAAARANHTATLLPSGFVLVAGGFGSSALVATAELYNPSTGAWSPAGTLSAAREYHTMSLLPGGKVLAVGGFGNFGPLASTELYDPTTNAWTASGPLTTARYTHTATLTTGGQVFVVGGYGTDYLAGVESFDPVHGTWTVAASMDTPRAGHTSTLLPNGLVYVAGGSNDSSNALGSASLFNPSSGAWAPAPSLASARSQHTATIEASGRILISGGLGGSGALGVTEFYDSAVSTWTPTTAAPNPSVIAYSLLGNGKVLAVGTTSGTNRTPAATVQIYDPATDSWSSTGSMNLVRPHFGTCLLPNGKVLVAGGPTGTGGNTAELYDPATGTWSMTGSMTYSRAGMQTVLLQTGEVLVNGGALGDYDAGVNMEIYNPAAGTWRELNQGTPDGAGMAGVSDGNAVYVGGSYKASYFYAWGYFYVASTGTFNSLSLNSGRIGNSISVLPHSRILFAGGLTIPSTSSVATGDAEIYDPATSTMTETGPLAIPRRLHLTMTLHDGRVMIAGGYDNNGNALNDAEFYDPATGIWSEVNGSAESHLNAAVLMLPSGKIYTAGTAPGVYDFGLGFTSAARPVITSAPALTGLASPLSLTGSNFTGLPGASGGDGQDSSTNYPLVQLQSVLTGQSAFLLPNPSAEWSANSFLSSGGSGLPTGISMITVYANGIPSASALVNIDPFPPIVTVLGENPVFLPVGQTYVDAGATALDPTDGNIPVTTSGTVDTTKAGNYTLTYTAIDAAGNSAVQTRAVNVGPTPFDSWRNQNFGPSANDASISGDLADVANDGLVNLLKYAFGANPMLPAPGALPVAAEASSKLVLSFSHNRSAVDIAIFVQGADSVSGPWTNLASSTNGALFTALVSGVTITETGASGSSRKLVFSSQ